MSTIGIIAAISIIFSGVGFYILRTLGIRGGSSRIPEQLEQLEYFVYSAALGLIVLVGIVFTLGLCGYLSRNYLLVIVSVLGVLTLRHTIQTGMQQKYCIVSN